TLVPGRHASKTPYGRALVYVGPARDSLPRPDGAPGPEQAVRKRLRRAQRAMLAEDPFVAGSSRLLSGGAKADDVGLDDVEDRDPDDAGDDGGDGRLQPDPRVLRRAVRHTALRLLRHTDAPGKHHEENQPPDDDVDDDAGDDTQG